MNPVVETYSRLAAEYDSLDNINSCWGHLTKHSLGLVTLKQEYKVVVDVGCGVGRELLQLASHCSPERQFIGIEPATKMRQLAIARTAQCANVKILDGSFEKLPLARGSVDYLYSILAFHWTTDLNKSASELTRVLRHSGEMDLTFIGRHNGREFIQRTTPIFIKYMTPETMVKAASLRKQLTLEEAYTLFRETVGAEGLTVTESYQTYYDTLDKHWSWWIRIEGQLVNISDSMRGDCDRELRAAIAKLETPQGIPYTVHLLHVSLRR